MKLVEPAYKTIFGVNKECNDKLVLTGHTDQWSWVVQTEYSFPEIRRLQKAYGTDILVLGFTKKAIKDVAAAEAEEVPGSVPAMKTTHTVDASIGLEAALVVLILEQKNTYGDDTNQYDVKRLVPSLTRGSNGLVIMWMPFAFDSIPKNQLPEGDGTRAIYENIKALNWFPC